MVESHHSARDRQQPPYLQPSRKPRQALRHYAPAFLQVPLPLRCRFHLGPLGLQLGQGGAPGLERIGGHGGESGHHQGVALQGCHLKQPLHVTPVEVGRGV